MPRSAKRARGCSLKTCDHDQSPAVLSEEHKHTRRLLLIAIFLVPTLGGALIGRLVARQSSHGAVAPVLENGQAELP
jgi:hypothetical protein